MVAILILVSVGFAVTLGLLMFGPQRGSAPSTDVKSAMEAATKAREKAEADLDKKRKDLEEQRAANAELRDQLKQAKRKLHDQKEAGKEGRDLVAAREEVERNASIQLEVVRSELQDAQQEIARLKAEQEMGKGRRSAPRAAPVVAAEPQRVIRELSPQDKEKMERLEHQASKDRSKAAELERELKRLKSKGDTQQRVYLVTKGEADLAKDKFKAIERRLNRTLLEKDLVLRALIALEKKSGHVAERTELTADEIAASDRTVDERLAAEAAKAAETTAKITTPPPTTLN